MDGLLPFECSAVNKVLIQDPQQIEVNYEHIESGYKNMSQSRNIKENQLMLSFVFVCSIMLTSMY